MDGSWVHAWLGSVIMRERERLTFSLGVKISVTDAVRNTTSRGGATSGSVA